MKTTFSDLEGLHYGYLSRYELTKKEKLGTLKLVSKFNHSDDFSLPVLVTGRLISSGTFFEPKYGQIQVREDELKKVHSKWVGKNIFKYHDAFWNNYIRPEANPIDTIVGTITNTVWNEQEKAVDYMAEIYDRDVAYKIICGLIKHVSVGFSNNVEYDQEERPYKTEIEPQEVSLVLRPKDKSASIIAKEVKYAV